MDEKTLEISSLASLRNYLIHRNLTKKNRYISKVPQICKDHLCVLGIMEAECEADQGPMVVGLVYCPLIKTAALEKFRTDNVSDLTEEDQEEMYLEFFRNSDKMGFAFDSTPSEFMPDFNNNRARKIIKEFAKQACIDLIMKAISEGVNIISVYVNTAAPPKRYEKTLKGIFPDIFIKVVQNYDSAYPVLAAANICSIVTKNSFLQVLKLQKRSFNSASEYQKHRAEMKKILENNPSTSSCSSSQTQSLEGIDINDEDEEHSPPNKKIKLSTEKD